MSTPTPDTIVSRKVPSTSFDKNRIRFLLLEGVHPSAVATLRGAGYENIDYHNAAIAEDELMQRIADAHFVGIRSRTQLSAKVLARAEKLNAIGCFCIGTNQVDTVAAQNRGIPVFNAPYSNTRSVAELVLAEAILLLRRVAEKSALAHRGVWQKSAAASYEIRGKVLGIVGYGSIGSQLSVLAESLGMQVVFFDTVKKLPLGNARQLLSLEALLQEADIVSLHVPETPATRNMMGDPQLRRMKSGAILLNASRGTVVDIDALAEALRSGALAGAAVDVFPHEPKSNDEEFVSPLRGIDNVFLTPHIGGSTVEAQENIGYEVAEKLIRYSDNGTTTSAVNFPEVALPEHPGSHRLLHIHRNVPGVMSAINQVFSSNDVNISAQYLQTNADIGYVVIDVDKDYSDLALSGLRAIDATIRTRVLF